MMKIHHERRDDHIKLVMERRRLLGIGEGFRVAPAQQKRPA